MVTKSLDDVKAARTRAQRALEAKFDLAEPSDFSWAHPILTDNLLERGEGGFLETLFWGHVVTMMKQTALRLSRKSLVRVFEAGILDPPQNYKATGRFKNTVHGFIQLAQHAYTMACFQHLAWRSLEEEASVSIIDRTTYFLREWCREPLTLEEMMSGMCLDVACTPYLPYNYLQAWDRVHQAMRAMPAVMLSKPARLSLTRLVFGWLRSSRPYGKEHEVQLMSQILLYSEVEREYGADEKSACEFFEITKHYHQRRILENKKRSAPPEPDFVELAPILGILGGAIPRVLDPVGTRAIHAAYAPHPQNAPIELDLRGDEDLDLSRDKIQWRG
jgi:hypothetical protein